MNWETIREWASSLGPLANVLGILGFMGMSGGSVYAYMKRRLKRQEIIRENLKQTLKLQDEEIEDLKREIESLRQYDPHAWLEQAEGERKEGNEEKAVAALRAGILLTTDALHAAYLQLAHHHIAIYPDEDKSLHLQEAERLAHVASLLNPDDQATATLMQEIKEIIVIENIHRGRYNIENLYELSATTGLYGNDLGEEFVVQLLSIAHNHYQAGQYIFFERVTHRARSIGLRELGRNSNTTCYARFCWATALRHCGYYSAAMAEIEELLLVQCVKGARHPETLSTRRLHAQILNSLGRYQEALKEIEELLPISERVMGTQHPDTLTRRHLYAQTLNFLGRYQEALKEVEELLPISERVRGVQHPDTLTTRYLHAQTLYLLEQYLEALKEVEELLPIAEEVTGAKHPDTLVTRNLHATILNSLGQYHEALKEVEELLPISNSIRGVQHPENLPLRYLYAQMLYEVRRYLEALKEAEELLLILEQVYSVLHPNILETQDLHKKILEKLKD
mgnify:CR=1 FL=1